MPKGMRCTCHGGSGDAFLYGNIAEVDLYSGWAYVVIDGWLALAPAAADAPLPELKPVNIFVPIVIAAPIRCPSVAGWYGHDL